LRCNHVALHLAGTARDRQAASGQEAHAPPVGVTGQRRTLATEQLHAELLHPLLVLGGSELAQAGLGTALAAGQHPHRGAHAEQRERLRLGDEVTGPVEGDLVDVAVREQLQDAFHPDAERRAARHRHPLVGERRTRQPPAVVDLTHQAVGRHEDVVEEDLIEHRRAGELPQWADVDARCLHVEQEVGDAVVPVAVLARRRTREQDAVGRLPGD
jgi:hypothetical protein